ncbi:MAG: phosphatase PAP2 family protein [Pseudomonadota bacterium]
MLSAIGSYWGAPLMGVALLGWRAVKRSEPAALAPFRFGVGVLVAILLAWTAKAAFALPRPSDLYANDMAWVLGSPDSLYAFPSGHAVYTAAVVASLWPLGPWPFRLLLLAIAAAVVWSRVALGAHFPADVVAGFLLGGACVVATHGWAVSLKRAVDKWRARR